MKDKKVTELARLRFGANGHGGAFQETTKDGGQRTGLEKSRRNKEDIERGIFYLLTQ